MDVKRTIAELTSQLSEVNYESEEENILFKDQSNNQLNESSEADNDCDVIRPSKLRKIADAITLPEHIYGGKNTSRKKTYSLTDSSENELTSELGLENSLECSNEESGDNENEGSAEEDNSSEPEDEVDSSKNITTKKTEEKLFTTNIYYTNNKNIPSDLKRGNAIRNQFKIWDSLLECRIKLQTSLTACNSLPTDLHVMKTKIQIGSENEVKINKCRKNLILLLDKMVKLQTDLLKQCSEPGMDKELVSVEVNEEIPSDESEIESDSIKYMGEEGLPPKKKQKLNNYSSLIKTSYDKFIPFRNASIQKWNDKTKVSTGKMANSNFSAFDLSTLKQIEQIMADKTRLINRTRIKRNDSQRSNAKNQNLSQETQEAVLDAEIFDDTDFYHKLLRDYIERKSLDVTSSSHTERQLLELQKLRNKMKKNVDTKSTKGRKLRFVVIPKLVNFMAPNPYNKWSEEAETELYNSLFGK